MNHDTQRSTSSDLPNRADSFKPRVSIGMPVYNSERWLAATLESILAQTFVDFELIISDNNSSDRTGKICQEYAGRDARIKYSRNAKNIGANPNFNRVFRLSSADYFKWASSNDVIEREMLAKCVEVLDKHPDVVLCYPRTMIFSDDRSSAQVYHDNCHLPFAEPSVRFIKLLENMGLNNVMNGLIRTEVLRRTTLIENYFSSDVNLMAEITLYGKIYEIPEYLFLRRLEPQCATSLKDEDGVLNHYDPQRTHPMRFQEWKMNFKNFPAVSRADIGFYEKAKLYHYLIRRTFWFRHRLAQDLLRSLS